MAAPENIPVGAPCWVDLATSDTAMSRDFYTQLLGWDAGEASEDHGGYFMFTKGGIPVAGAMPAMGGVSNVWSTYLKSENAHKTVETATANGAQVLAGPMAVNDLENPGSDLGTMAVLTDPGGAAIGLWQPGTHKGFGAAYEPSAPSWFELHTRDYRKSVDFYRDVFSWNTKVMGDSDEFRYTTDADGDTNYAGIMDSTTFLPDGVPAHWLVYFGVENTDAALDKLTRLGGSVVRPPEDTPYGRLASATDSTGTRFNLVAESS
jgi:uncharacterized protein